jgi:5-methylcytosine-specific restriction enzyme subunit McrC
MSRQSCRSGKIYCVVCSMIRDKGILIKNIYYMLAYAFQILKESGYDEIASEEFENIHDLFAFILSKGISNQLKRGIYRDYLLKCNSLSVLRGKLDVYGTIMNKLQRKQLLSCEYDEMSENNLFNKILKTTAVILQRQPSVSKERRKTLKKLILYLDGIDIVESSDIQWDRLRFHRNNQHYKMLLNICYFVLSGLLLSTDKGQYKMAMFLNEQDMHRLFEKFVLEYYRYHYPELNPISSRITWNIDSDDVKIGVLSVLPIMQTDITLRYGERVLIIDTKYYSRTMQRYEQYASDKWTFHSNNLYQIFTYVKNQDVQNTGNVAGMLLYAKTEETIAPDHDFHIRGNLFSVKTLDLNMSFRNIAAQLDRIAMSYFGDTKRIGSL